MNAMGMEEGDRAQRGFRIRGRVQGVGFRWWTRRTAVGLGLDGTVENCPDGTVEVHARGSEETLDLLASELESGPGMAHVVEVEGFPSNKVLTDGFRIV